MGLINQLKIEVSFLAFEKASKGAKVNGRHGESRSVWIRAHLGEEVEDTSYHPDQKTEYRKFVGCTVEFAESLGDLRARKVIRGATRWNETLWIFAK